MVLEIYARIQAWPTFLHWRVSEHGAETIEWIGIAAAIFALLGLIIAAFQGPGGQSIAGLIVCTMQGWIAGLAGTPAPQCP